MKLAIIFLLSGPSEKYHKRLVKEVGPKFGEMYLIESPLPSHVTLKSPFTIRNSKKVEEIIERITNNNKKTKIKVGGFGHFRKFVAFMKFNFSKQEKQIQKELIKELKKIGINPHDHDINWKPHATISYANKKETFDNIWTYLGKKNERKFEIFFDNISILKKYGEDWRIYKEFKLTL